MACTTGIVMKPGQPVVIMSMISSAPPLLPPSPLSRPAPPLRVLKVGHSFCYIPLVLAVRFTARASKTDLKNSPKTHSHEYKYP